MQVVYAPTGVPEDKVKRWPFEPQRMTNRDAEAIERHTKMTFGEWQGALERGSMLALHGLLFVLLRTDNPVLKWDEIVFSNSEVSIEYTDEETANIIEALEAKALRGQLSETETLLLSVLRDDDSAEDPEPGEAPISTEDDELGEPGKAPAA